MELIELEGSKYSRVFLYSIKFIRPLLPRGTEADCGCPGSLSAAPPNC